MISYLKGIVVSIQKSGGRVVVTLEVNQVGYEVQIVPRLLQELPTIGEVTQIFTHLQVRDDQPVLFGFASSAERQVFRQLLGVSGVGPQLAIALLDSMTLTDLVQAIVTSNTKALSRTPGVGTKTAERLALELRSRLAEWRQDAGLTTIPSAGPTLTIQEDVEMTLLALGYSTSEINQALQAVGRNTALPKNANAEDWIRSAIAWLSQ